MLKNTALTAIHEQLGAKMAPFAGYNMPISYTNIIQEHHTVREKVGIFDVSHMGEFIVRGPQALDLVQHISSNDASKLQIGEAQYACMPNKQGGIIDDLLIYRLPEDNCAAGEKAFMLVVNASNIEKDWNWIMEHHHFDTRLINISDQTGLLAVQGPLAQKTLQALTDVDLSSLKYYTFTKGTLAGVPNVLISATGYTGAGGFELYADNEHIVHLWEKILEAGKDMGILPVGLGARDTLRLEMGYCLYGNDINDETSPLEAGLGWITKLGKAEFIGKDILVQQKAQGIGRKLVGIKALDRRVPRHGYPIENEAGELIGGVTSSTQSPSLDIPIGMGYVTLPYAQEGSKIYLVAGKKRIEAIVSRPPFLVAG